MNRMPRLKHRRLLPWFNLCRCLHRHDAAWFIDYQLNALQRNGRP